jgi:nucleotide-binding universal stress UspA family protein
MAVVPDILILAGIVYKRILVTLEHSATDAHILEHIRPLARHLNASLVLVHVADGFAARNVKQLQLRESEEIRADRAYLEKVASELNSEGLHAEAVLAGGDPAKEIIEAAKREQCDLIAMATHGHKLLGDVVYGSVANEVRHGTDVPVLLLRAK